MSSFWDSGWRQRLHSVVHQLGYEDIFSFVMSQKQKSFGEMFGALRKGVNESDQAMLAMRQFEEMFYIDAEKKGQFREAFMEALVRSLNQYLHTGWNQGKKLRERRIDARHRWPIPGTVSICDMGYKEWEILQCRIWKELELVSPPDEWCPRDFRDPIIQDIFARQFSLPLEE